MSEWTELAEGVLYRRFESWNLNVGLVLGETFALVIDTRVSPVQGRQLRESIETIARNQLLVVNTHAHLDHCLGNQAFGDVPLLAHEAAITTLTADGPRLLRELAASADAPNPAELVGAVVTVPTESVDRDRTVDLGGRRVRLVHRGRGHTTGDLVVEVMGTDVCFGGDLIRGDGAPWFGDAFPLEWPTTLRDMLSMGGTTWMPGHGQPMATAEVAEQAAALSLIAESIESSWVDGASPAEASAALPISPMNARAAVDRGFAALRSGG